MHKRPLPPAGRILRDHRVRIIGGCWRGRKLPFPESEGLRPTGDRIRETLFNWLMPVLPGAHCLDLFAGSGALGFEALSRGAADCVMLERNPAVFRQLQANRQLLSAESCLLQLSDTRQWLANAVGAFNIVFIDPPFADTSLAADRIMLTLLQRGLLASNALVYVEQPSSYPLPAVPGMLVHRQQQAGQVSYSLWRAGQNNL